MSCTPECWTPVRCPVHGGELPPRGRSVGLGVYVCCERDIDPKINARHLWDEHDSVREITDPDGWHEHEKNCTECNPPDEDDD